MTRTTSASDAKCATGSKTCSTSSIERNASEISHSKGHAMRTTEAHFAKTRAIDYPLLEVPPARRGLIRVHRFGTESLRQRRFSPHGRERAGAPFCPHPLCPPLPLRGRGGLWSAEAKLPPALKLTLQHSKQVRARLTPLPHCWRGAGGEGEKSASVPHAANPSAVPLSEPLGRGAEPRFRLPEYPRATSLQA